MTTVRADSVWRAPSVPVPPSKALLHSLVVPGWGQMDNGKKLKAALFFAAEAVCIGGYIYMNHRVENDDVSDWERENLRTDRNTFLIYWMASKLFGIMDAYVDAQLAGFDISDITPEEIRRREEDRR